MNVKQLLAATNEISNVSVGGWVRSIRSHAKTTFLALSDGSTLNDLQVVLDSQVFAGRDLANGTCLLVQGDYKKKPGERQDFELVSKTVKVLGSSNQNYPLSKTKLPLEYLRRFGHLKSRTRIHQITTRIRSLAINSIFKVFHEKDFLQTHPPIITGNDAEGGGDVFQVSSGKDEFFSKPAYLTVSSQLHLEMLASGISRIYCLNPAFRAESSASTRHLAEFWMLEAELAFIFNIHELLDFIQDALIQITREIVENNEDLGFCSKYIDTSRDERIKRFLQPWGRLEYTKAISILQSAKRTWDLPVKWGLSLQTEHEKYLAEEYVKGPVFVTNYPASAKPFYMKLSPDGQSVECTDLLVPKIGELIGGSLREDSLDLLQSRILGAGMNKKDYDWYLDLRRYGTVPHGGFGMGLERYLAYITGIWNVKDWPVAPRYLGHCNY